MTTTSRSSVPPVITPEYMTQLAQETRERARALQLRAMGIDWIPDEDEILDDRPRMHPTYRRRMQEKGLQHELPPAPLTVVMVTDMKHTVDFPCCHDEACICYELQREAGLQEKSRRKSAPRKRPTVPPRSREEMRPITNPRPFRILK
jgi:hypothetical protein